MSNTLAYSIGDRVELCYSESTKIGEITEILNDQAPNRKYAVRFGDKEIALSGNEIAFVGK